MLPLIRLPECPHCGTDDQGTRAKGGNSVRCAGCGTMRRVPMYRRTTGVDDPRATVPVRGKPLQPGHPWRFQPGNKAGSSRPATGTPVRSSSRPRAGSPAAQQTSRKAPATETFTEIIRRLKAAPDVPLKLTTDSGDGTDCQDVARIAAAFDNKYPEFGLYWEASKTWKSVKFWIKRPEETRPRFTMPRENTAEPARRALSQPPRRMPNQQPRQPAPKPTYVNPDTCPHTRIAYDPMADAYRCPDCSYARPAWA